MDQLTSERVARLLEVINLSVNTMRDAFVSGDAGDATAGNQVAANVLLTQIRNNSLPFNADYVEQSNPDGGGNYQTIVYKTGGAGGTTVKTITLTFDGSGSVLTYTES